MKRTLRITLLTLLILTCTRSATAQYSEQQIQSLRTSADALSAKAAQERSDAEVIARRLQLPIRQVLPDGTVLELQRFAQGRPVYFITDNATAASSNSADKVYPGGSMGFALTGNGVTLGVWDGGSVRTTHQELNGRVTQMDATSSLSDHATHVSGTMIAAGVKSQARGMAYEAELLAHDWTNDLGEMSSRAASGLQVSNHSYSTVTGWRYNYRNDGRWVWFGDAGDNSAEDRNFGLYDSRAREWDDLVHTATYYLPIKSAGNDRGEGPSSQPVQHWEYQNGWKLVNNTRDKDGGTNGYDCISTNANAKNILTVGAVEDLPGGYSTSTDVRMSSFSGWGPTDDGRIKPDLVANGTALYSSLKSSNAAYASYSGTSMSAPSVAGSIGLLLEHQSNLHGSTRLRASTIKALLLHSADESGPAPGPDFIYGWGMMNTAAAAKIMQLDADGSNSNIVREEQLQNNAVLEYEVYSPGRGPIKVTICWTDPAGPVQPSQVDPTNRVLVNDLDLRIVDPQSNEHLPWTLDRKRPGDAASRGDNITDNVEQVFISAPAEGVYTIRVSHKGAIQGSMQIVSIIASVSNAPSLMSPPSGLTSLSPSATLQWTPAQGALSYEVQVAATPDFKNSVINSSGVLNPWLTLSGLQRLHTYYWHVRAQDQQGWSDWSDVWNFETGGVPALAGHALYFDGADDELALPHRSGFDEIEQQDAVTIEAWVNVLSWYNGFFSIVDKHDPSTDFGWLLQMHKSGGLEFIGSTSAKCNFIPKLGEWNHIAVSYSRSEGKIRFFVNGARRCEVDDSSDIRATNGGPLYVGFNPSGSDEYSHGMYDELRIWKTARSESEINANLFSSLSGNEPGLVSVLRLNEGQGLTTAAAPGSSDAQLTAGPAWLVSSVPMEKPPAPALLYPGPNSANIPVQPELRWIPATSAMSYRVQLSATSDFRDLLLDERNVVTTAWDAGTLDAESAYFWRVNATNVVGTSDWSAANPFVTAMAPPLAPKLVSPRADIEDQPLQVTLLWEAPDRAQRYHVQVSTDPLFTEAFVVDRVDLISPTVEAKDLGNFQTYYWRVRAINVGGTGSWSEVWSFVTLPAEPDAPVLLTPAVNEKGVAESTQFTWEAAESAATYSMQLATDSAFTNVLLDVKGIPFTKYAAANLQKATWHYWRVRAANSAGMGPWSAMHRFMTTRPAPEQVVLVAPANTEVDVVLQPLFRWLSALNAETFQIEVATTDAFVTPVFMAKGLSAFEYLPTQDLEEMTEYFWRVRAENESGEGLWSETWSFTTTLRLPAAVTLLEPLADVTSLNSPVEFRWTSSAPLVTRYWHEWAEDAQFVANVHADSTLSDTAAAITVNMQLATDFWWRVRAGNATGWGPWSTARRNRLNISAVDGDDAFPKSIVLHQNFPNPVTMRVSGAMTILGFTLPTRMPVQLEIRDLMGRRVNVLTDETHSAGTHTIHFDASGLAAGQYLIVLRTMAGVLSRVMTIIR